MKNLFQHAIFSFAFIAMAPSVLTAQAWTKSKGTGFYKLDFTSIKAADVFDPKGKVGPFRTVGNYTSSFYGEYGITNKITAVAYVPFFVRNTLKMGTINEKSVENNGFGDVDLGLRFALPVKNFALSANLFFGLPTGEGTQTDALLTGDGEFNQMLKLAVGTGKKRWWTQAALGFNNRTKGFSDEFRYDFEFGYKFFEGRFLAMFKINGIESFNNGTVIATKTGLYSNNVEYGGIGPEFLYYANAKKTIGISGRVAGAFKGQNVLAAPSFSVGAFAEF